MPVPAFISVGEVGRNSRLRKLRANSSDQCSDDPRRCSSSAPATWRATRSIILPVDSTIRPRSSRRR